MKKILLFTVFVFLVSCEPLVNTFEKGENIENYKSKDITKTSDSVETVKFMTWNIRFGVGRTSWFGDCCGDRVIIPEAEVKDNLQKIADFINKTQPDILFLQEIDEESNRTAYIDQVKWLLNHTDLNYGVYASMWDAQYIPSDGLGRINTGNAILSRWKIKDSERIQLPLRGDQDGVTKYFYLRRNLLKTRIELPGLDDFYALCVHMSAFSTDDTKQKQINKIQDELINMEDAKFFLGGDFNLIPPGSDSIDFCQEDGCEDDKIHQGNIDDADYHKEGSYFGEEIHLLQPLYDNYNSAVPLDKYLENQLGHFTHSTQWDDGFWDRKLDYIFTNKEWIIGSDSTYQEDAFEHRLSDHVPVSVEWRVEK